MARDVDGFRGTGIEISVEMIEKSPRVTAVFNGDWKGRLLYTHDCKGVHILAREKGDGKYQIMMFPIARTSIFYETLLG